MADVIQELCDYEKRRLRNAEKNIELMKTLGKIILHVQLKIKNFKDCIGLDVKSKNKSRVRKTRRRRYSNCSNSSSDSGDEWTPALETCVMKKKTNVIRGNRLVNKIWTLFFCV